MKLGHYRFPKSTAVRTTNSTFTMNANAVVTVEQYDAANHKALVRFSPDVIDWVSEKEFTRCVKPVFDASPRPGAMAALKAAMQADSDYAWTWHCNIAMAYADEGATHEQANRAASRFMRIAFDIDVTTFDHWLAFPWATQCNPAGDESDSLRIALEQALHVMEKGMEVRMMDMWPALKPLLPTAIRSARLALRKTHAR